MTLKGHSCDYSTNRCRYCGMSMREIAGTPANEVCTGNKHATEVWRVIVNSELRSKAEKEVRKRTCTITDVFCGLEGYPWQS